jgi:acetyl-CoA carboxylase biotin carboxyl carrier protein
LNERAFTVDTDEIKSFVQSMMEIMRDGELEEVEYEEGGVRIKVRRAVAGGRVETVVAAPMVPMKPADGHEASAPARPEVPEHEGLVEITSPMVGTFYEAPSPEADPYVHVGEQVDENSVICIIEAMKVMNEIKAEVEGKIVEILVENGQVVEYGQPLFLIDPRT